MFVVHSKEEEEQKVLKPQRLVEPKQVTITLHFKDEFNCRIRANCGSEIIRNCIVSKTGTQNTRNSVFKHVGQETGRPRNNKKSSWTRTRRSAVFVVYDSRFDICFISYKISQMIMVTKEGKKH